MEERSGGKHSPALQEAQRQLEFLRARHLAGDKFSKEPAAEKLPKHHLPHHTTPLSPSLDHLGWGSIPLTAALSIALAQAAPTQRDRRNASRADLPTVPVSLERSPREAFHSARSKRERGVKVYPDIALGMLRKEQAATGRIWLLLKYMDVAGRGWISVAAARDGLARKNAEHRVCGWRQLRKLLARGEGLFWHRNGDRIWLRSAVRVAAGLGVCRLSGCPVTLPVDTLLQGIGIARAHLFATFHSSRVPKSAATSVDKPISRGTLRELSQVSRQTQAQYERRANVRRSSNFAVGGQYNTINQQNSAWRHGWATFKFRDEAGRLGKKGAAYTAWQLPNNYVGPHERRPKGQQKRINRELADLFMKGMTGNGKISQDAEWISFCRFFDKASTAAASYNLCQDRDLYWPSQFGKPNRYRIWHCLGALK